MVVYHTTDHDSAIKILSTGFRDHDTITMTVNTYRGCWVSNEPLGPPDGSRFDTCLKIALKCQDADLRDYEWVEDRTQHREWLVPADILNEQTEWIRIVDLYEERDKFQETN